MDHYIYVFRRENGWHKIGIAARPSMRLRQVESKLQEPLALVSQHGVPRSSRKRIEQRVHALLAFCREELEWFSCDLETADIAIGEAMSDDLTGKPMPLKPPTTLASKYKRTSDRKNMRLARDDDVHARFLAALDSLHWSASHLALILGCHRNLPTLWVRGMSAVPVAIVDWLDDLAAYHAAHPPPDGWRTRFGPHPPGHRYHAAKTGKVDLP